MHRPVLLDCIGKQKVLLQALPVSINSIITRVSSERGKIESFCRATAIHPHPATSHSGSVPATIRNQRIEIAIDIFVTLSQLTYPLNQMFCNRRIVDHVVQFDHPEAVGRGRWQSPKILVQMDVFVGS